ncbi:MAG TPA: hypothetical protein VI318_09935 [Baekduia sp.]
MSGGVTAPIVVADGLDVTFHRSADDVGAYYEPWFPDSVEYRAFDAEGRRLELHADGATLAVRPAGDDGAEELATLLRETLRGPRDRDDVLDGLTLGRLLELAVGRAGFLP